MTRCSVPIPPCSEAQLKVWMSKYGWTEPEPGKVFICNQEESIKPKNIVEKIDFDSGCRGRGGGRQKPGLLLTPLLPSPTSLQVSPASWPRRSEPQPPVLVNTVDFNCLKVKEKPPVCCVLPGGAVGSDPRGVAFLLGGSAAMNIHIIIMHNK